MVSALRRTVAFAAPKPYGRFEASAPAQSARRTRFRISIPPRALLLLDLLTLVLVATTGAVAASGGWRVRLDGELVVSIRVWWRPLVWALAVGLVRHIAVPAPSLYDRVRPRVHTVCTRVAHSTWTTALGAALGPVLISRTVVYAIGLLGLGVIGLPRTYPNAPPFDPGILYRWDAGWYLRVAEFGYSWNGNPRTENPVVFFPAYPMLIRGVSWLTGLALSNAGLLLSMTAFAWAAAYVYRIAKEQLGVSEPVAAVSFLAWYPFAVFFGAVYTESLFLLAVAGAFYHARRHQRLQAAGWALLASLAKPNGFLVAAPLAMLLASRLASESPRGWSWWRDRAALRTAALDLVVPLASATGIAAYSLYMWVFTGDALAWLHGQQAWGRAFRGPVAMVDSGIQLVTKYGVLGTLKSAPVDVMNSAAALFCLAAILPVWRRLGPAYALLIAVSLIPPLLNGGTMSVGRFSSCLFPVFVWLALAVPARRRPTLQAVFASGQALVATLFLTHRPPF